MSDAASKSSITIKKYANRRLYNTATSTYVTLEDLSQMVKDGIEFNVYDAKTSEDITRSVLTQIIVEEESKSGQQNLLPISFLRQLIGFYGDSLQWMVPKYLEQSMESLTGNQDRIREYFQSTSLNIFPFGTTLEDMSKQNMAMFERTMGMFSPFSGNLSDVFSTDTETNTAETITPTQEKKVSCPIKLGGKLGGKSGGKSEVKPEKSTTVGKSSVKKEETPQKTASITNLKPRNENPAPSAKPTPMPNVQASMTDTGADDMQQKIANLQRQLADLAKSRA